MYAHYDMQQLIRSRLNTKYDLLFHFYEIRPLRALLSNHQTSDSIHFTDLRLYTDDAEYLRRVYYHHTLTGRPQISHRLKLCADYYAKNQLNRQEYPMMIVTDTKTLFMNREKRLRKILAGEGSSDESQQQDRVKFECSSSFLAHLHQPSRTSSDEYSEVSYCSQVHDVFQSSEEFEDQAEKCWSKINLQNIQDTFLSHLICDFTQNQKQKMEQTTISSVNLLASHQLKNRGKKNAFDTLQISNILNEREEKIEKSLLQMLQKQKSDNELPRFSTNNESSTHQKSQRQLETQNQRDINSIKIDLETRRRKIRQKAEELLKKVRTDSYQYSQNALCQTKNRPV